LCRGHLNHAKETANRYDAGEPGCWWIKEGDFLDGTGASALDELTNDFILDVNTCFSPPPPKHF
jgi:hypothetical protein